MLVIQNDEIVRIPDPNEEVNVEPVKVRGRKKEPTFRVFCVYCQEVNEIKQRQLVLRSKYGVPVNSFYCPSCDKRNYFFSEKFALNKVSLKLLRDFSEID